MPRVLMAAPGTFPKFLRTALCPIAFAEAFLCRLFAAGKRRKRLIGLVVAQLSTSVNPRFVPRHYGWAHRSSENNGRRCGPCNTPRMAALFLCSMLPEWRRKWRVKLAFSLFSSALGPNTFQARHCCDACDSQSHQVTGPQPFMDSRTRSFYDAPLKYAPEPGLAVDAPPHVNILATPPERRKSSEP